MVRTPASSWPRRKFWVALPLQAFCTRFTRALVALCKSIHRPLFTLMSWRCTPFSLTRHSAAVVQVYWSDCCRLAPLEVEPLAGTMYLLLCLERMRYVPSSTFSIVLTLLTRMVFC